MLVFKTTLKEIAELYSLLSNYQKTIYFLQVLMIFSEFLELIGIASIAPFIGIISDKEVLYGENILAELYRFTEIIEVNDFIIYMGMCIMVLLTIGVLVSSSRGLGATTGKIQIINDEKSINFQWGPK